MHTGERFMKQKKKAETPGPVFALQERIADWRNTRKTRNAMPESLWREAASLAGQYGAYVVARDLSLHYGRLKQRVVKDGISSKEVESYQTEFVDLSALRFEKADEVSMAEVTVSRSDGLTLSIRQSASAVDIARLVESFCRSTK